jgi:hypothetical protein
VSSRMVLVCHAAELERGALAKKRRGTLHSVVMSSVRKRVVRMLCIPSSFLESGSWDRDPVFRCNE